MCQAGLINGEIILPWFNIGTSINQDVYLATSYFIMLQYLDSSNNMYYICDWKYLIIKYICKYQLEYYLLSILCLK